MALRLIDAFLNPHSETGATQAKVYFDEEYDEFRVRFYNVGGIYQGDACDYHSEHKDDAVGTAKLTIGLSIVGEAA